VAELEDKLSKVHITEEEMKAFHKVSALLAGAGGVTAAPKETAIAAGCVANCTGCINECGIVRQCILRQCVIRQPIAIRVCTFECMECGPGLPGGGGIGGIGGQFGGLGG
jgi:hypothetical protein